MATVIPLPLDQQLSVSLAIRRPVSLRDYAHGVIAGTNNTLSHADFESMFAPAPTDLVLVRAFAQKNNLTVDKIYTNSATVKLIGTAADYNRAFNITLTQITDGTRTYHSHTGTVILPDSIKDVVEAVLGLDNSLQLTHSTTSVITPPYTPEQVATAYQYPAGTGAGECVGVLEFSGGYTQDNLTLTFNNYGVPVPQTVDFSVGGATNNPDDSSASQEVVLDIAVVGGVVPDAKIVVYFAPNSLNSFYNCFNAAIFDKTNSPSVLSLSWGAVETAWGFNGLNLNNLFLQAIALGITIVTATGDYGSRAYASDPVYSVQFPSSSPYVLACGGTSLSINTDGTINNEVVWNSGNNASAGGISSIYNLPSYQNNLTATEYPSGSQVPVTYRAIPDLALNADPTKGYKFWYGPYNIATVNAGTSAAAPMMAGLVVRLNAATGRRLGFLNTLLYANPQVFRDITQGNNACPPAGPGAVDGYSATAGWDACTGLGSPIGTAILALMAADPILYPNDTYGARPALGQQYPRLSFN